MLSSSAFWQTQNAIHGKDSNALPKGMLVIAGVLVTYRHMTQEAWEGNQLKTFLALIMLQMLPLVLLEVKIPSCPDPMALLSQFGSKVLLMHACFLGLRAWYSFFSHGEVWDTIYFLGACAALHQGFGFRPTLRSIYEHRDVLGLVLLAMLTAFIEESISYWSLPQWQRGSWNLTDLTTAGCNYTEILAFVPALWIVCRNKAELSPSSPAEDAKTRRRAIWFFAFLVLFYICEDLGSVPVLWQVMPLAAIGHTAHFMLVLDFAGFMLAHVYSPEKIKQGLMKMTAAFGAGTLV